MTNITWDDLLDEFEDTIDECHDALDAGRTPTIDIASPDQVPQNPPTDSHRERFEELLEDATSASNRIAEAMAKNSQTRSHDRERVQAHRRYATAAAGRRTTSRS